MTGGLGRAARIVLGLAIMSVGLFVVQGTPGMIMAVVALVPISGGLFDFCLTGAAMGYPLRGAQGAGGQVVRSKNGILHRLRVGSGTPDFVDSP